MIDDLEVVALPYHLDALKQVAGTIALKYVAQMERGVADVVAERERLLREMRALPLMVWPSQANFILFRPNGPGRAVWQALLDQGVLVRDCSSWEGLTDCLRVTIGSRAENDAFFEALRMAVSARD